ncbi:MAG: PAS domain S-box protein [Pseudomonadota bacterium]
MNTNVVILIFEAVSVYLLVLWAHSLRHRVGLAPFYALLGGITAVMSWVTDAGVQVEANGVTFMVGSTVFYTAILLGVFVVYVFDGPHPTRIAIITVAGVSIMVPLIALTLHAQMKISGHTALVYVPLPSLRINAASVAATVADLIFLAMSWEFLGKPRLHIRIGVRAFLTLLGVMWLDVLLFATGAFAGTPNYFRIVEGTLLSRLIISVFAWPFLYLYLNQQNLKMGHVMVNRPVLAILKEVAEVRAELGFAKEEIERRKNMENQLKKSYHRLNQIIDFLPDPTFVIDQNGRVLAWNKAVEELTGVRAEDMIGKRDYEYSLPFYGERRPVLLDLALEWNENNVEKYISVKRLDDGVLLSESYHPILKGGIFLSGTARVLYDGEGQPEGAIESVRDITHVKIAEKELKESQRRLAQIIEFLPDATMVINAKGRIIAWNQAIEKLTGVKASDMVGKGDYEYALPFYGKRRSVMLDLVMMEDQEIASEYLYIKRDGNRLVSETYLPNFCGRGPTWLWNVAAPLYNDDGRIVGAIEAIRDITDRKKAEQAMLQSERYKAVVDLASGVAHNFNNVLQIILGNADLSLIRLKAGDTAYLERSLNAIIEICDQGAETVKRLNRFASFGDLPKDEFADEVFDLSEAMREAVELTRPWWWSDANKRGISIEMKLDLRQNCLVKGKKGQIIELSVNLIKNAIEAMPEGGQIGIQTTADEKWAHMSVSDTGIGIPEEKLGNLFNPFYTTSPELGRGLGLSTCMKIVDDHGGEIKVESNEGDGTTFNVIFPRTALSPTQGKIPVTEMVINPLSVLAIDDMPQVLEFMKQGLSNLGHTVLTAESGEQALQLLDGRSVDVTICDLGMPGMNGWQVAKAIKNRFAEHGFKKPLFIILTGWANQDFDSDMLEECGVDAVITKPVDIDHLAGLINQFGQASAL